MAAAMKGTKKISQMGIVRNNETGSPFDQTHVRSAAVAPPGQHPKVPTEEADEDAFRPFRHAKRPDPTDFLRRHSGIGGNCTKVMREYIPSPESKPLRGPPRCRARAPRENPPNTDLRLFYERGDLPCIIDQRGSHNKLAWKAKIEDLDLHWLLPVLFDGLREEEEPYKFIAKEGVLDVLENGGDRILPVVPQLIVPIKNALNTRRHRVMCVMLKMLQKLVTADVDEEGNGLIGRALVPFYRQILPVLNLFYTKSKNIGDEIDYAQRKEENLGELIQDTLQLLEVYGGEDALVNIKYLVPVYESAVVE